MPEGFCCGGGNLKAVMLGRNIKSIGDSAFRANKLENVVFPNSLKSIGAYAFAHNGLITDVNIPDSVTSLGDFAFHQCFSLTRVTIGSGVTALGSHTFSSSSNLESVIVGRNVQSIGSHAFAYSPDLGSVLFLGNRPEAVGNGIFEGTLPALTVHYLAGAGGWELTFEGYPTKEFDPLLNLAATHYGSASAQANPRSYNLFAITDLADNRLLGRSDVTSNPSAFNLFTQQQFDGHRLTGRADVISNPMSYGLYDSNSIMDLRMGGAMVQKQGNNAVVTFQPQTTTDLTQPFTNNGTPITNTVPMPGNKGFLRIQAR